MLRLFLFLLASAILLQVLPMTQSSPLTICIDPGHPSESGRGTAGKHLTEIEAAWEVGKLLKKDLLASGFQVVMTKASVDEFVTNKRRAEIANEADAALMVRLHCDADAGTGIAIYAPDRQGSVAGFAGPSEWVISQSRKDEIIFHKAMIQSLGGLLADRGIFADTSTRIGGQQGALTGSIYSKVPVVLVEMCVLTNPHDEAIIASKDGQAKIAAALCAGAIAVIRTR